MLQFYFLSILTNAVTGCILFFTDENDNSRAGAFYQVLKNEKFSLVMGVVTFVTGFFKLLTVVPGDVPVVGDLIPAVCGLLGGFALLYYYYSSKSEKGLTSPKFLQKIILEGKKYLGLVCMIAARAQLVEIGGLTVPGKPSVSSFLPIHSPCISLRFEISLKAKNEISIYISPFKLFETRLIF